MHPSTQYQVLYPSVLGFHVTVLPCCHVCFVQGLNKPVETCQRGNMVQAQHGWMHPLTSALSAGLRYSSVFGFDSKSQTSRMCGGLTPNELHQTRMQNEHGKWEKQKSENRDNGFEPTRKGFNRATLLQGIQMHCPNGMHVCVGDSVDCGTYRVYCA